MCGAQVVRWGEAALAGHRAEETPSLASLVSAPMSHIRLGLIPAATLNKLLRPAKLVAVEQLLDALVFHACGCGNTKA